jgi:hypothetical protein
MPLGRNPPSSREHNKVISAQEKLLLPYPKLNQLLPLLKNQQKPTLVLFFQLRYPDLMLSTTSEVQEWEQTEAGAYPSNFGEDTGRLRCFRLG